MKPILNQFVPAPSKNCHTTQRNELRSQQEELAHVHDVQANQPMQFKKATTSQDVDQRDRKQKHSKEDVDAGNTLLIFLQELRKNHKEALNNPADNVSEVTNGNNQQFTMGSNSSVNEGGGSQYSTSAAGLISESKTVPEREQNGFNSLKYDPTISYSTNKDDSVKSELSNESSSSYVSSEDDQKIYIESGSGPIRKRFRRHDSEFSS